MAVKKRFEKDQKPDIVNGCYFAPDSVSVLANLTGPGSCRFEYGPDCRPLTVFVKI